MGMVLVDFRWRDFLRELGYGEKETGQIGEAVFLNPLWQQFDWGNWKDEDILSAMKKETPEMTDVIDKIWDNFKDVCRPFSYSETLVKQIHESGYRIYILSNFGKKLFSLDKEMFTFLNYVDGGIISSKVNQMKPNEDIFETLFKKYDIVPENAVFFDDNRDNCETARRLNLAAVEVEGLGTILDGLEEYTDLTLDDIRETYPEQ